MTAYVQPPCILLPGVTLVTIKAAVTPGVTDTSQMRWSVAVPVVRLEWTTDSSHNCLLHT